jgi:hypothetical protein
MEENNENCRPSYEKKQGLVHEEQHYFAHVSDDSGSILPAACGKKKCKSKTLKLKDEQICSVSGETVVTAPAILYATSVSTYLLEVKLNENQEDTGSVLFPRILPASTSTWECNLLNHMLAHINFCTLLKYFRSV